MNKAIHTVELPVLEMPRNEVGILAKRILKADLEKEQPKKKIRQDVMLASIEGHEHAHELEQMIKHEFQCDMIEISSGNGRYTTDWNPEGLRMANASEQSPHDSSGLAEHFDTGKDGMTHNSQESDIYDFDTYQDDSGNMIRVDDLTSIITVDTSSYSVWDTIAMKGSLIVRKSGHWVNGKFDAANYQQREARRMKAKNKRLLGMNHKSEDKQVSGYEARQAKRLAKLAQRRGNLAKIGYNAIQ